MKSPANTPEFSRPFSVDKLRDKPSHESLEANEAERLALIERLQIVSLEKLEAELDIQRSKIGEVVQVTGKLSARVVQTCVVTLENFSSDIEEEISAFFGEAPAPVRKDKKGEEDNLPLEDEHAPDPINDRGEIDLGELVTQHLSLALDPYPRKPGAEFKPPQDGGDEKRNPFAVLADFRAKKK